MACSNPKTLFVIKKDDEFSFFFKNIDYFSIIDYDRELYYDVLPAPCRKCYGCKQDRINFWKNKLRTELYSSKQGIFTTLTFDEEHLEEFSKDVYQKYFKRLRKQGLKFKYFIVAELGEKTFRPHFHCIFFGLSVDDEKILREKWNYGFIQVKPLVEAHFSYCVNYLFKSTLFLSYSKKLGYVYLEKCKEKGYYLLDGYKKNFPKYFVKNFLNEDQQILNEDRIKQFYLEQEKKFKVKYGNNWKNVYFSHLRQKNEDLRILFRLKNLI